MKKNKKYQKKIIKVAYFIDSINSIAGTEKQLIQMMQHLNTKQFDAQMICLQKPSGLFDIDKKNFKYFELGIESLISLYGFFKVIWLVHYLRKEKIDIIQTYFFDATVVGVIAGRIAGVKNIISCRRDLGFWHTPKLLIILKIINKITTRVLANSYAVKDHVMKCEKVSGNRIDVIKNGIDINLFGRSLHKESNIKPFEASDKDYIVGIVANLNRYVKRVDVFIKSASEVLKIMPNVSFIIVGDGHFRDELERMAEQLNILNKFFFMGRRDKIYSIIKTWDIGIISSDSEGFSNSILEYMASAIPVIATDVGGNKEVIENGVNGFLVPPGNYKAMADKICNILQDRKTYIQMSKNARSLITIEHDWSMKIKEIQSYYTELIFKKKCI